MRHPRRPGFKRKRKKSSTHRKMEDALYERLQVVKMQRGVTISWEVVRP